MRYSPVKVKIIQRGLTIAEIIRKLGLHESLAYMTLRGERHNREIQDAIAKELDEDPRELWGESYSDSDRRRSA